MNRLYTALTIVLAGLLTVCVTSCAGPTRPEPVAVEAAAEAPESAGAITWADDWKTALTKAGAEDKAVLVTFYADWCIWCKKLDSTTLADTQVATFLRENVVPLRLDVDNEGRSLSEDYRVDGLPTVLVLNSAGEEIGRIPGYLPPDGFLDRMQAFLG